jgi:hypothetical protein
MKYQIIRRMTQAWRRGDQGVTLVMKREGCITVPRRTREKCEWNVTKVSIWKHKEATEALEGVNGSWRRYESRNGVVTEERRIRNCGVRYAWRLRIRFVKESLGWKDGGLTEAWQARNGIDMGTWLMCVEGVTPEWLGCDWGFTEEFPTRYWRVANVKKREACPRRDGHMSEDNVTEAWHNATNLN